MSNERFNDEQIAVITHSHGPMVVSAGAGSGKTRVLVERVVNRLTASEVEHAAEPVEVMSITFTNKAANELLERVISELRAAGRHDLVRRVDEMWISTIHSMCVRILRENALDAGIDPGFEMADAVVSAVIAQDSFERVVVRWLTQESNPVFDVFEQYPIDAIRMAVFKLSESIRAGEHISMDDNPTLSPADIGSDLKRACMEVISELHSITAVQGREAVKADSALAALGAFLSAMEGVDFEDPAAIRSLWEVLELHLPEKATGTWPGRDSFEQFLGFVLRMKQQLCSYEAKRYVEQLIRLTDEYVAELESSLERQSLFDFDGIQHRANMLFEAHPWIAEEYEQHFKTVQIDEFQDTNETQRTLVDRIGRTKLVTVGDVQQSIYRFRGADVAVYRKHAEEVRTSGGVLLPLTKNYRSHPDIIDLVNRVFAGPEGLGDDFMRMGAARGIEESVVPLPGGKRIEAMFAAPSTVLGEDEHKASTSQVREYLADWVADKVRQLVDSGWDKNDIVLLFSAGTQMQVYAEALDRVGVECVSSGSGFFEHSVTSVMVDLCRVLANPLDEHALVRVLASDMFAISDQQLLVAASHPMRKDSGLFGAMRCLAESGLSIDHEVDDITRAFGTIDAGIVLAAEKSLYCSVLNVCEDTGFDLMLLSGGPSGAQGYAVLLRILELIEEFESKGGSSPRDFVELMTTLTQYEKSEPLSSLPSECGGPVRLMTIHSSKGLEFPIVFVPELDQHRSEGDKHFAFHRENGIVSFGASVRRKNEKIRNVEPDLITRRAEDDNVMERRRLLYVAMTRAREALYLCGVADMTKPMVNTFLSGVELGPECAPGVYGIDLETGGSASVSFVDRIPHSSSADKNELAQQTFAHIGNGSVKTRGPAQDSPTVPARISYSGFSEYLACGRRFFAERILRVGELALSSSDMSPTRFGTAFHAAAEIAGRLGNEAALERIPSLSRQYMLDRDSSLRLETALRVWFSSDLANEVFAYPTVRHEVPFAFILDQEHGQNGLMLDGNIDLLAEGGGEVLVVDYKTGGTAPGESNKSYQEIVERYRLQAECYALAVMADGATRVRVSFVRPEVMASHGEIPQVDFEFSQADSERIRTHLLVTYDLMKAGEFEPAESRFEPVCTSCPINGTLCIRR